MPLNIYTIANRCFRKWPTSTCAIWMVISADIIQLEMFIKSFDANSEEICCIVLPSVQMNDHWNVWSLKWNILICPLNLIVFHILQAKLVFLRSWPYTKIQHQFPMLWRELAWGYLLVDVLLLVYHDACLDLRLTMPGTSTRMIFLDKMFWAESAICER